MNTAEERRKARLECKTGLYRELKCESVRAVRRDKEARVRGVFEAVESYFWSLTLDLATEENGRCVSLGPRCAVLQQKRLMAQ